MTNYAIAKATELAELTSRTKKTYFTDFLSPVEAAQVVQIVSKKNILCEKYGGYDLAERNILGFSLQPIAFADFPISIIRCQYPQKFAVIGHRDILGSIIALGIDRKGIGDIIATVDSSIIIAESSVAEFISTNLIKIGRTSVYFEIMPNNYEFFGLDNRVIKNISCSSLRVDAVLATVFQLSRGEVSKLAKQGKIFINWRNAKGTACVQDSDMLTLRGYGRLQIKEINQNAKSSNFLLAILLF